MYRTCMHCLRSLEANVVIEAMPVGRRLAFDAARGRLWIVCRGCERWNLTPFEERWEAIEQCERAFRGTTVRVSTDHIGLARLPDGTELVRIGAPQRPEFAAWRYGDQFGRRRRRSLLLTGGVAAGAGVALGGAVAAGAGILAALPFLQLLNAAMIISTTHQTRRHFPLPDGGVFVPVGMTRLIGGGPDGWGVDVGYAALRTGNDPRPLPRWFHASMSGEGKNEQGRVQLYGNDALPVLRWAMPLVNRRGAGASMIAEGVRLVADAGGPARYPVWAAGRMREWAARASWGDTGALDTMPRAARLAFEMAMHEESERQAMEGALAQLARAWADAEQIAAIADDLLLPTSVFERVASFKRTLGARRQSR